jgi:hypothetical protein
VHVPVIRLQGDRKCLGYYRRVYMKQLNGNADVLPCSVMALDQKLNFRFLMKHFYSNFMYRGRGGGSVCVSVCVRVSTFH